MSKFARIVAPLAMLAVMSIGSAAHAQDAGSSSQQAGATTPGSTPTTTTPGQTPGSTPTTTTPPAPKAIPVTTNWSTGRAGTTVKVSANVRGCTRPGSARGEFRDHAGAVRPLADQLVTWNSRFSARFVVDRRDAVGWGKVRVVCDIGLPTATQGFAEFWVAPVPGLIAVTVTPTAGGPGTVVTVRADLRGSCDPFFAFFEDSKGRTPNLKEVSNPRSRGHQVVGRYTITSRDAVGRGRFGISCNARTDYYRIGYASFWVGPRGTGGSVSGGSGGSSSGGVTVNRGKGTVQVPTAIDTGLGGTADGDGRRGTNPVRLLPPAWVLLIVAAVGLRIYQAIRRRSQ